MIKNKNYVNKWCVFLVYMYSGKIMWFYFNECLGLWQFLIRTCNMVKYKLIYWFENRFNVMNLKYDVSFCMVISIVLLLWNFSNVCSYSCVTGAGNLILLQGFITHCIYFLTTVATISFKNTLLIHWNECGSRSVCLNLIVHNECISSIWFLCKS